MMKQRLIMTASLMELLAIPLSNLNTIAKWLVIPQAGEGAKSRFVSFTLNNFKEA